MKMIYLYLILTVGIILVGGLTVLSKNQPLLEYGFKELFTMVYAGTTTPTNETPINETPSYNETHKYIYEPESKTWIIVPKDDFKGGETPLPPEEPIEDVTYTPSERIIKDDVTGCVNGKCSATLGKVRFAPYQNKWYELEKAPSLRESSRLKAVVKYDGTHIARVIDYNLTFLIAEFSFNESNLQEFEHEVEDGKMKTKIKINDSEGNEIEYEIEIEENTEEILTLPFGFDKIIKFGENSTTIQLQDADTENLGDTNLRYSTPTNDLGTCQSMVIIEGTSEWSYLFLKFNISKIPVGGEILFSSLNIYIYSNGLDNADEHFNLIAYDIPLENHVEGGACTTGGCTSPEVCWTYAPVYNATFFSSTKFYFFGGLGEPDDEWINLTITDMLQSSYSKGESNFSLLVKGTDLVGTSTSGDSLSFETKEDITTGHPPFLNVTFYTVDETPPVITNLINTSTTNQSSVINWTTDEISNGSITYGVCPNIIGTTLRDSTIGTIHNFSLTGLTNSTWYCMNASSTDSSGNIGHNATFNFTTAPNIPDTTEPSFSNNKTNASSTTYNGTDVQINLTITDDTAVDWYRLTVNDTSDGVWVNQTLIDAGGVSPVTPIFNYSIHNFTSSGGTMGWQVWANDTVGNSNVSEIYTFTVQLKPITFDITDCTDLDTPNAIYYLINNIVDSTTNYCMNILENNITLDCQGHTIDSDTFADYGVYILRGKSNTTNIIIKNCTITDWDAAGLYFRFANNVTVQDVTVERCVDYAIDIHQSDYITFSRLTSINNTPYGLFIDQSNYITIEDSVIANNSYQDVGLQTTDSQNYCSHIFSNVSGTDNKPIVFYNNGTNLDNWNNNVSSITLCNAHNSNITNLIINKKDTNNNGLQIIVSNNVKVINLTAINTSYGILLYYSNNSILNISILKRNSYGIFNIYSNNTKIINTKIEDSHLYGSYFYNPSLIYIYNNLFNNTNNFIFGGTKFFNNWNTSNQTGTRIYGSGTNIGGNYWTNSSGNGYSDTCTDSNTDGFCDTPYNVTSGLAANGLGNNVDYLPYSDEYTLDSCTCPASPAEWHIINGDECSLDSVCNIYPYHFRVLDGRMSILSGGYLRANGCYVEDGESIFIEESGGLYCES